MKQQINIILGVFFNQYFVIVRDKTNSYSYSDFESIPNYTGEYQGSCVYDCVVPASEVADNINFLLDKLFLPLNPKESVTCEELEYILKTPKILAITQFWLKGEKVAKDKVLQVISTVKQDKLVFENLDLNTF